MKKVALITTNNILAQSLDATIKAMPSLEFEFFLFLNAHQALLDAKVFEIDVALIDLMDSSSEYNETPFLFYERLHKSLPNCSILLLVSQDDMLSREMAAEAKKKKIIDDFVFYDASLKYLFAKLEAF